MQPIVYNNIPTLIKGTAFWHSMFGLCEFRAAYMDKRIRSQVVRFNVVMPGNHITVLQRTDQFLLGFRNVGYLDIARYSDIGYCKAPTIQ